MQRKHRIVAAVTAAGVVAAGALTLSGLTGAGGAVNPTPAAQPAAVKRTTPIAHLVVIFGENVSFDHYFGTYPTATNTGGSKFTAAPGTPKVNGLSPALLTANPNGVNPKRLDPTKVADVLTCDQNHGYGPEQTAFDKGAMDKFPVAVGTATGVSPTGKACASGDVMNYYDGNASDRAVELRPALRDERQLL